ncbi:MAG TPA: hypothetical protein VK797_19295 [Tepidisphaeraceae bacterium]|nr:hypothetical protein [Tepidisphaeraceae bacterium]
MEICFMDAADGPIRVGSPPEAELPIPKRFWWLKRSPVFLVLPVLVLAAARSCSLYLADRQFARELQSLRDRGEPVDLSPFRQAPVPASEDAAPLLRQAALAASNSYRTSANLTVQQWVARNANALRLVRQARSLSRAYWGDGSSDPKQGFRSTSPRPLELIRLSELLSRAADLAARRGNATAVIEYMRDSLHAAALVGQAPDPGSQNVAMVWQMMVTRTLDGDSPALVKSNVNDGVNNASLDTSTCSLIAELLDSTDVPDAHRLIRGMRSQAIFLMTDPRVEQEGWLYFRKPTRWEQFLLFLFRARIRRADLQYLQYLNGVDRGAADVPYPVQLDPAHVDFVDDRVSMNGRQGVSMLLHRRTETVARRRMAALGLAISLYQREHRGKFPGSVDELVPKYLAEIPRDPFDPAGSPLRLSIDQPLRIHGVERSLFFGLDHPIAPMPTWGTTSPFRSPRLRPPSRPQPASRPDH